MLWVLEWASGYDSATWARALAYMSVFTHFESFGRGVLDSKDAVFYLTAKQPFRTASFAVGALINLAMAVQVLRAVM